MKYVILAILVISISSISHVYAAGFDARINPANDQSHFEVGYQKTVFIDYPNKGTIYDELYNTEWTISDTADITNPDVQKLLNQLNNKIASDQSQARITNLNVYYDINMKGRQLSASIDYNIVINGTISNYIITTVPTDNGNKTVIDIAWRGLTVNDQVIINDIEINIPINIIQKQNPVVYDLLVDTTAIDNILTVPIMNSEDVLYLSLDNWHYLFDPTGINKDASQFGLSEEISGFVVSSWTMGESSIREGRQVPKFLDDTIQLDQEYTIRSVRGPDDGTLRVIGFGDADTIQGIEIIGITDLPPEGYANTSTGDFPVVIIYGMAVLSAVAGIGFFIFSNRISKNQSTEQTGIDPAHLVGYETSASAGGYKTNRGEAHLLDSDHQKTQNVYHNIQEIKKDKPVLPKGF